MGLTIYQHHTHPQVAWYQNLKEWHEKVGSQGEVTVYIKYPRWYQFLTHNIYVHPAHHVNARIPLYRLHAAQAEFMRQSPELTHVIPFSLKGLLNTLHSCKLYDYDQHQWLDFAGNATTAPIFTTESVPQTAEVVPLQQKSA